MPWLQWKWRWPLSKGRFECFRIISITKGEESKTATVFISKFLKDLLSLDEEPLIDRAHQLYSNRSRGNHPDHLSSGSTTSTLKNTFFVWPGRKEVFSTKDKAYASLQTWPLARRRGGLHSMTWGKLYRTLGAPNLASGIQSRSESLYQAGMNNVSQTRRRLWTTSNQHHVWRFHSQNRRWPTMDFWLLRLTLLLSFFFVYG